MSDTECKDHPLKRLLLSDLTQYSGTRILLLAMLLTMPVGWSLPWLWDRLLHSSISQPVLRALLVREDSLRNYVAAATPADLARCRSDACTLETLPAVRKAAVGFDTSILWPPTQVFHAPAGKVFVNISLNQTVPFVDGSPYRRFDPRLADVIAASEPIPPPKPIGVHNMHAFRKRGSEGIDVASPGLVLAVQPENSGVPALELRGDLKAWADYVRTHGDPDELRFSMIEFQPAPSKWRFSVPEAEAAYVTVGDAVDIDFEPGSESPDGILHGKVSQIEPDGARTIVEATPVQDGLSDQWLANRIGRELLSIEIQRHRPAVPDSVRVSIVPTLRDRAATRPIYQVPLSSVDTSTADRSRAQLWVIVEDFLVPVEVRLHGRIGAVALIEETPAAGLPVSRPAWNALSQWQRSRVLALTAHGKKGLIDRNNAVVSSAQTTFRPGAPARSKASVTDGGA